MFPEWDVSTDLLWKMLLLVSPTSQATIFYSFSLVLGILDSALLAWLLAFCTFTAVAQVQSLV